MVRYVLAPIAAMILSSCNINPTVTFNDRNESFAVKGNPYGYYKIIVDLGTGCEYISQTWNGAALIPRVDRSGEHICTNSDGEHDATQG